MRHAIVKLKRAWDYEGVGGIVRRIRKRARYAIKGVDFSDAYLPKDDGTIANLDHAYIFRTASIDKVRELVGAIPAADKARVLAGAFVDLGCGKGEPLYAARMMGFRRVIGVELIPDLVRIGKMNMERLGVQGVEFVVGDASAYTFPDDLTVLFMANPFDEVIMDKVMANVARQGLSNFYIVYIASKHRAVIEGRLPDLVVVHEDPASWGVIFKVGGTPA